MEGVQADSTAVRSAKNLCVHIYDWFFFDPLESSKDEHIPRQTDQENETCSQVAKFIFAFSCVLFLLAVGLRVSKTIPLDDAYITFSYAKNLAQGNGFVFNSLYDTWGTTTPFFTLLLSLFGMFNLDLLWPARFIDFLALTGQAVLGCLIFSKAALTRWRPVLLFVLIFFLSQATSYPGMEYGLYAFCNVGALTSILFSNWLLAAVFASVAPVIRIDGGLTWIMVLVAYLFHTKAKDKPIPFILILCFLPSCWYTFALIQFGSIFPQTLGTRRLEATVWGSFGEFWWRSIFNPIEMRFIFVPALFGFLAMLRHQPRIVWFVPYSIGYVCLYTLFKLPGLTFYLCTINLILLIFTAVFIAKLLENIFQNKNRPLSIVFIVIVLILLRVDIIFSYYSWYSSTLLSTGETKYAVYKGIGNWLREDLEPDATYAGNEIGILGYYGRDDLIEIGGLVNKEGVEYVPGRYDQMLKDINPDIVIVPDAFAPTLGDSLRNYDTLGKFKREDQLGVGIYSRNKFYNDDQFMAHQQALIEHFKAVDGL